MRYFNKTDLQAKSSKKTYYPTLKKVIPVNFINFLANALFYWIYFHEKV
ncbi:hypothetical protein E6C60_3985 [Paenibacillus algicola]|uniref:Uncharacterized protein n=1 Tax=Paenibacillus algicola TaxID=2565926 RepID=A0A4P8XRV3_9BACL|nr:hypothetical protein E6C60_3985 [Paenibacillus algicola]